MRDPNPTVVLIPGLGMIAWGKNKSESRVTAEFYNCAIEVMRGAEAIDRYEAMDEQEAFDIEYWDLEEAKLKRQPPEKELDRQVVVVIGAGAGIGKATAHRVVREGAHVVCVDLDEATASATAQEIVAQYGPGIGIAGTGVSNCGPALALSCDITNRKSVQEMFANAILAYGGIDAVVVTAGVFMSPDKNGHLEDRHWTRTFEINVTGAYIVADEANKIFKQQNLAANIVLTTSANAVVAKKGSMAYDASKAAANHLVRELAIEMSPLVRVNAVAPATVVKGSTMFPRDRVIASLTKYELPFSEEDTDDDLRDKLAAFYARRSLTQSPVEPEDQAEAIFLLISRRLKPNYPVPYGLIKPDEIASVLNRVHGYLDQVTPAAFVNSKANEVLTDLTKIDEHTTLKPGDFRIVSYEWGVTYAAMLLASEATGDPRFRNYTETRLKFIADAVPFFRRTTEANADWGTRLPLRNLLAPRALDDCGAMCAAMIKANRGGSKANLLPLIENHINYIMTREYRLQDGTLARYRPQPNTIWLDDLFMSVPAMAQMGKFTGEAKYFDEASKQVLSYAKRMFNKEKGLFFHGWVEAMTEHPEFYWARANGWAFMTQVELLEVLPQNHPSRQQLLQLLRAHAKGLASYQSGSGFWHQLLDRHDSYLETSATAIYTYGFARAINRGWIDPLAYGPMTLLAWNAVSTKVNMRGQVEGTCVGTGMAFDPAFYYHRPTSPFAAHGYGPVLLAGAEVINLLKNRQFEINDSSVQTLSAKEAQK